MAVYFEEHGTSWKRSRLVPKRVPNLLFEKVNCKQFNSLVILHGCGLAEASTTSLPEVIAYEKTVKDGTRFPSFVVFLVALGARIHNAVRPLRSSMQKERELLPHVRTHASKGRHEQFIQRCSPLRETRTVCQDSLACKRRRFRWPLLLGWPRQQAARRRLFP